MGGGIGLGSLADRLGRKPCLLVSVHLYIGAGVVLAIVPTFSLYVVVRFIQGALVQVNLITSVDPLTAELFLYKPWRPKVFFQFEILINVLVN